MSESVQNMLQAMPSYHTLLGAAYCGNALDLLGQLPDGSVNLVVTSPPFALQRQKAYGNKDQAEYIEWLLGFCKVVKEKLRDDGSFVIDLGGAYQKNIPVRSLYNYRLLIRLCDEVGFHLAEEFFWFNPAKLPSPIEWVNKRKIRAKDSVNTVWWLSKTEWPNADVRNVLTPYSDRMKKLLENPGRFYTPAERPSGHDISDGFGKDNGGAIPSNLLQISNTSSNGQYESTCKRIGVDRHPARFPQRLPKFFIDFLTSPGDVVLDIFAGSNTTGRVAEDCLRRWLAFEIMPEYVGASVFRFHAPASEMECKQLYEAVRLGGPISLTAVDKPDLFSTLV
jgi:site-specific DNA-methyltransferase (cytosine-N4-specific)